MEGFAALGLLSLALYPQKEIPTIDDWQSIYNELSNHAVLTLTASIVNQLNPPEELRDAWKKRTLQQITNNIQYEYVQKHLPISVPYVILKGTSAAQYYPHPEYRTMGDIDVMTRREDFERACNDLIQNGFCEIYDHEEHSGRHRSFVKQDVVIEIHLYFAMLNDPQAAQYLDDLIVENINNSHVLPDMINGLTILEHISQHLEEGLGLRQIIDWMMFVDKCLPDDQWPEFENYAKRIGLDKLAVVATHMCEIYLGLPQRKWCEEADESTCQQLMNYVLSSGNFGKKMTSDTDISKNVFASARTIKSAFALLQNQGLINWKAAAKHKVLRPFAWIYQLGRYIVRGLRREQAITKLKSEILAAHKRTAMFDMLGVKTSAKGVVVYKDGKYVKE